MKAGWSVAAALALVVAGCGRSPLKGGTEIAADTYWRLNMLGDGERLPNDSDSVLVRVRVARPGAPPGSLFSTERWYPMAGAGGTERFFGRLRQGDSATVLLPAARMPWAALGAAPSPAMDTGWAQMELALLGLRSPQASRERARAALMARTMADEERITAAFLAGHPGPWKQALGLQYLLDSLAMRGPRVQSGDLVTIAYSASFLDNGRVFDNLAPGEGGLTFRLGDPDQVIKGIEAAVHLLPARGGSGTFIIPSALAFGPEGSSSGIVPPWTPLLYRVTVLPRKEG